MTGSAGDLDRVPGGQYTLLSHLRWAAAFVVVGSHIQQTLLCGPHPAGFTTVYSRALITQAMFRPEGYGHAAVVVFFVLSGFLVGGKLIGLWRSRTVAAAWPVFLIDRFTRISIVLWPALLVAGVILGAVLLLLPGAAFVADGGWSVTLPGPLAYDLSLLRWVCAPLLLNEFAGPTLQIDGPLWSLAYEWSYYIGGLAVVLVARRVGSFGALAVIGYAGLLLGLAAWWQPAAIVGGCVWTLGIGARWAFDRRLLRGRGTQALGVAAVMGVLVVIRFRSLPDPVLGVALALMISHPRWAGMRVGRQVGERLAGFSFSLYVLHFPVIVAVMGLLAWSGHLGPFGLRGMGLAVAGATLVAVTAISSAFAAMTEAHTHGVRDRLVRRLLGRRGAAEGRAAA